MKQFRFDEYEKEWKSKFTILRCPRCTEFISGMKYRGLISQLLLKSQIGSKQMILAVINLFPSNSVLSISNLVFYDNCLPLYVNIGEHKPKWKLLSGLIPTITYHLQNMAGIQILKIHTVGIYTKRVHFVTHSQRRTLESSLYYTLKCMLQFRN